MSEEETPTPTETPKTIVEQAREERVALEKVRDELREERVKIQELKANDLLGGETQAGGMEKTEKETMSAVEYAARADKGEFDD